MTIENKETDDNIEVDVDNLDLDNPETEDTEETGLTDLVHKKDYAQLKSDIEQVIAKKVTNKIEKFKDDFLATVRGEK